MKKIAFLLVSSALILFFAGCSFRKNSPAAGTETESKAAQAIKVTAPWPSSPIHPNFSFAFMAKEKGFFSDAGIDIDFTDNQGSAITSKLIGSGEYPIGMVDITTAMIAKSKGVPLTLVAVIDKVNSAGIICHKEANVNQPADLYGKTIGLTETKSSYQQYLMLVKKENLDRKKIIETPMSDYETAFLSGKVDCVTALFFGLEPKADLENIAYNHLLMKDYGIGTYGPGVFVNSDFLKKNPILVKKAVGAFIKGLRYSKQFPDETLDTFFKLYPDKLPNRDFFVREFQKYNEIESQTTAGVSPDDGMIDKNVLASQKALISELGFLENDFNIDDFFSNAYLK